MIRIQDHDFNLAEEYEKLLRPKNTGAVVTFVGRVRDFGSADSALYLQHYPGMTEKSLAAIEHAAHQRWSLLSSTIIHRVGRLQVDEQIVFVGVSSAHRKDAFSACEFMIDLLKTEAPFWKKEGTRWVEAKASDKTAAQAWKN